MSSGWLRTILVAAVSAAALSCSPDPYNLHPQAYKVESIVTGGAALDLQEPREGSGEYVLMEGKPYYDGGIVWQPFYLTDIEVTTKVGDAILQRKSRYPEVFGLLARGVAGEGSNNRIVPRVSLGEITAAERRLIDDENRDRDILVQAFMKGKRINAVEAENVRRVVAYARYQLTPPGVWVERAPGEWVIRGGRDYRARVMAREPVEMRTPSEPVTLPAASAPAAPPPASTPAASAPATTTTETRPQPVIRAPRPRVR